MRLIEQKTPAGTFACCRGCRREPRHVLIQGRSSRDPVVAFGPVPNRHMIECACGQSTNYHESLDAAVKEWGVAYAQQSLPLHVVGKAAKVRAA